MGVTMEYGHPLTTWLVDHVQLPIGKANTPLRNVYIYIYHAHTTHKHTHTQHTRIHKYVYIKTYDDIENPPRKDLITRFLWGVVIQKWRKDNSFGDKVLKKLSCKNGQIKFPFNPLTYYCTMETVKQESTYWIPKAIKNNLILWQRILEQKPNWRVTKHPLSMMPRFATR